ncbi:hypothetical protein ACDF64_04435 [Agromyces sp. MMS24-JH15]
MDAATGVGGRRVAPETDDTPARVGPERAEIRVFPRIGATFEAA